MNDTLSQPNPPIMPQAQTPAVFGPPEAPGQTAHSQMQTQRPKKWVFIAMSALIILLGLLVGSAVYKQRGSNGQPVALSPTPTPSVGAIDSRPLSPMATESAFIDFENQLDIVTLGIQNASIDNQILLPPRLDLPLGF